MQFSSGETMAKADRFYHFNVEADEDDVLVALCEELPDLGVMDFTLEGMEEMLPQAVANFLREREGGIWSTNIEREGKRGYCIVARGAPAPR